MLLGLMALLLLGAAQVPAPALPGSDTSQPPSPTPHPGRPGEDDPDKPLHIGGQVKPPLILFSKDPEFSEAARRDHVGGTVLVYCWVSREGRPLHVAVAKGIGYGLDEKAVEAVKSYRFRPASLNGDPVVVDLYVQVTFRFTDHGTH